MKHIANNIVLVGAGGTGMSGVAGILWTLGFQNLVCIDGTQSQLTDKLLEQGMQVIIGHGIYDVQQGDIVIYSAAAASSPEVVQANNYPHDKKQIKIVRNYFEFLGEISKYFQTVGVIGTNGKSTTTALGLACVKDLLPQFGLGIVGAMVPELEHNSYIISQKNKGDIKTIFDAIFSKKEIAYNLVKKYVFMLEACEYKRHFLHLDMDYALLTSLECDHLDYFKDEADYVSAFAEVINATKQKCFLLTDGQNALKASLPAEIFAEILPKLDEIGTEKFKFDHLFGAWNQRNASLLLYLFTKVFALDKQAILAKFKGFTGLRRRMESLGKLPGGALLYSDYGHMASSLQLGYHALRDKYPDKKIVTIFQPHQLRRVVTERDVFVDILKQSDETILYTIYAAREKIEDYKDFEIFQNMSELSIDKAGELFAEQSGGIYMTDFDALWEKLQAYGDDSIVVIYSAGDLDYLVRGRLTKMAPGC